MPYSCSDRSITSVTRTALQRWQKQAGGLAGDERELASGSVWSSAYCVKSLVNRAHAADGSRRALR